MPELIVVFSAVIALAVAMPAQAQDPSIQYSETEYQSRSDSARRTPRWAVNTMNNQVSLDQRIRTAADDLAKAKTQQERTRAKDRLASALSEDYDDRLGKYARELERLEAQLVAMKDRLEKRRDAKERLIELRITLLENEAKGLGWPQREPQQNPMIPRGYGPATEPRSVSPASDGSDEYYLRSANPYKPVDDSDKDPVDDTLPILRNK